MARNYEAERRWRLDRKAGRRLENGRLVHLQAPHGTKSGYSDWFCRCQPCTTAHRDALRDFSSRRLRDWSNGARERSKSATPRRTSAMPRATKADSKARDAGYQDMADLIARTGHLSLRKVAAIVGLSHEIIRSYRRRADTDG